MANYYSNLYTEAAADNGTYNYNGPAGTRTGEVVWICGMVAIDAAIAASDVGYLFPIPAGAKLNYFSYINTDCGNTLTADFRIGTTDFIANAALGTAVTDWTTNLQTINTLAGTWTVNASSGSTINFDIDTSTTPAAGTITFLASYVMT